MSLKKNLTGKVKAKPHQKQTMVSNNVQFFLILLFVLLTLLAVIALIIIQVQIIVKLKKAEKKIKQHPLLGQLFNDDNNNSATAQGSSNLIQNLITTPFVQSLIQKTLFAKSEEHRK